MNDSYIIQVVIQASSIPFTITYFTLLNILKYIKLYISERKLESAKICYINIHLTINPSTFNKYGIYMYMIVKHYQNKNVVQQRGFFSVQYDFIDVFTHTQNPSKVK